MVHNFIDIIIISIAFKYAQCTLNHAGYILVIRGGSRKSELGGHTETELL